MTMSAEQLRRALADLNGTRDVRLAFDRAEPCVVKNALLVPVEADGLLKMTDGSREYVIDAERVIWLELSRADEAVGGVRAAKTRGGAA